MDPGWERGIVVGKTTDSRTLFIASSHDTLIMHTGDLGMLQIGDCIEFLSRIYTGRSQKVICQRLITEIRKCSQFVEFKMEARKNTCLLICDIVDVKEVQEEEFQRTIRVLRTNFIEEVFDSGFKSIISHLSESALLGSRAVCKRILDNSATTETWVIVGILPPKEYDDVKERSSQSYHGNEIDLRYEKPPLTGFVCTIGSVKEDLYVWVPGTSKDLYIRSDMLRAPLTPRQLYGRWISFEVNKSGRIYENSNIQLIDDVMPTRKNGKYYEVRVRCFFDLSKWDNRDCPILESNLCGNIVDDSSILRKYNRLRNFEDEAWVYNYMFDEAANIRFVLSTKQEKWNVEEEGPDRKFQNERTDYNTSRDPRSSQSDEKMHRSYSDRDYTRFDNQRDRVEREDRNYGNSRYSGENGHYSGSTNNRDLPRGSDDYRDDYRSEKVEERIVTNRSENSEQSLRSRYDNARKPDENVRKERSRLPDFERSPSVDSGVRRIGKASASSNFEEKVPVVERRVKTSQRSETSKTTPDLDNDLIKSLSINSNKKSAEMAELEKLQRKWDYLVDHDLAVPDDLMTRIEKLMNRENSRRQEEELSNLRASESYSNYGSDDTTSVSSRFSRNRKEKPESTGNLTEELAKYKRVVDLLRNMLSDEKVCQAMRAYDPRTTDEINKALFHT